MGTAEALELRVPRRGWKTPLWNHELLLIKGFAKCIHLDQADDFLFVTTVSPEGRELAGGHPQPQDSRSER